MKKSPFSPSPFLADFVDNLSILDITKQLGSRGGEEGRWREEGRDGDGGRKGGRESERERERERWRIWRTWLPSLCISN